MLVISIAIERKWPCIETILLKHMKRRVIVNMLLIMAISTREPTILSQIPVIRISKIIATIRMIDTINRNSISPRALLQWAVIMNQEGLDLMLTRLIMEERSQRKIIIKKSTTKPKTKRMSRIWAVRVIKITTLQIIAITRIIISCMMKSQKTCNLAKLA